MEGYHLNKDYKVSSVFIAEINETVIIIDDFLHSLEPIYQFATETAYFQPFGSDGTSTPANVMKCQRLTTELLSS